MDRPNIILITTDQQRYDALGINGNLALRTPNLDSWAAGGANFTRAYTTCPSCIAARRTILTGLHPSNPLHGLPRYQDGVAFNPPWTLPGLLGDGGYQTQLIGKLHMYPQRKRFGFDHLILSEQMEVRRDSAYFAVNDYGDWLERQGHLANPASPGIGANGRVARPWPMDENLHHTSFLAEEARRFIVSQRDPSCPFFLHLSFWAPHPPLIPPQAYWDRYAGDARLRARIGQWAQAGPVRPGLAPDAPAGPFSEEEIRDAMAGYYGLINHIDDRLAFLLDMVFQRGSRREDMPLWIIFTSDHGEMLGDHHLFRKSLPYEGSAHVPFFISGRNVDAPRRESDALVSLEDLLPTICDLAGVKAPEGVDGRSLAPILRGEASQVREKLHGEHGGPHANQWIVSGRLKYCWFAGTNEEQLFDLAEDPHEMRDLSDRGDLLEPMRRMMSEHLKGRTDYQYDTSVLRPLGNRTPTALWKGKPAPG